ncbi:MULTISPECIES: LysE family translocator [Halomonas]|uniref:LysE family translocator n=2 Tax=Halomonas TaxID=2745 RepID=E1VBE1_HALED|nr:MULTISPECIES: LysE family translocator [Halomonas]MDR5858396.1 LysE family translocator [Halomonas eurihalina]RAW06318.1 LysE family translocator [Halomonas elongata]TZG41114.1 LysE family translocator [Halomonas eurihalina]WBF19479.1 LysE family translocator [Halomonas elongata]WPU48340.1 LysE family translocator [Halomonas elongata DSM 2581]
MLTYSLAHWMTFLSAAVLLNLSPGPDMAFILGQTARHGRRGGVAAMFGVWSGAALHVGMAALGLSAVLATSALAFSLVKWIGAAYLVWLGLQILLRRGAEAASSVSVPSTPRSGAIFRQGILVSALNPKVAIFFLAFLPQFVVPGAGPAALQLALHGALIILVAAVIEPPLVFLGARLARAMSGHRRLGAWLEKGLGGLFVLLGVKLALSER